MLLSLPSAFAHEVVGIPSIRVIRVPGFAVGCSNLLFDVKTDFYYDFDNPIYIAIFS
jgi:hypothetical protein